MAQFTIYKSSDASSPILYGTTGSLLVVLDACLVNGYGTKPAAGWLKPIVNATGNGSPIYGCYQQPTGSGLTLFINDNSPNQSALGTEAWATGWESLSNLGVSPNTNGTGSGQFPTPAQSLTSGHVVIRKSATNDSSSVRQWIVAADSSSFYMFMSTGDTATMYYDFAFGDIYSFNTTADSYKCIIIGRNTENTSTVTDDGLDAFTALNTPTIGNYMARSFTGLGTSVQVGKHGDGVKGSSYFYGSILYPNPSDSALYLSPIWVVEPSSPTIRGQLRGLYQPLHASTNFTDGQIISGSLDYNGKMFEVIRESPNAGAFVIEISNTLLTN